MELTRISIDHSLGLRIQGRMTTRTTDFLRDSRCIPKQKYPIQTLEDK